MDKLRAVLIIEMLGKPKENLKKAMSGHISKLGSEKGVRILNKSLHEPTPLKESKDLLSAFAEVEVEFSSLNELFGITFAYMPSNIQIITPERLAISNDRLSELISILVQRLHDYEAVTKRIVYERNVALKKLQEFAPHLFKKKPTKKKKR